MAHYMAHYNAYYSKLTDRTIVRILGIDGKAFLQDLITNDIAKLTPDSPIFTALLTPQGKLLFDFIVWERAKPKQRGQKEKREQGEQGEQKETCLWLDVDKQSAAQLAKRLNFYKLRAAIEIAITDLPIYALWTEDSTHDLPALSTLPVPPLVGFAPDPRKKALGARWIGELPTQEHLQNIVEAPLADYHAHRIACGVPQGIDELGMEQNFPLECNFHELNAIDFQKGCFIGQEVTSRIYRRENIRKKIHVIMADTELTRGQPIIAQIKTAKADKETEKMRQVGEVCAIAGQKALALLRQDSLTHTLFVNDKPVQIVTQDT